VCQAAAGCPRRFPAGAIGLAGDGGSPKRLGFAADGKAPVASDGCWSFCVGLFHAEKNATKKLTPRGWSARITASVETMI